MLLGLAKRKAALNYFRFDLLCECALWMLSGPISVFLPSSNATAPLPYNLQPN